MDDLNKLENVGSVIGKAVNEVKKESGVPSLINRALKNHNSYSRFIATYYRPEVITNTNSDGFKSEFLEGVYKEKYNQFWCFRNNY